MKSFICTYLLFFCTERELLLYSFGGPVLSFKMEANKRPLCRMGILHGTVRRLILVYALSAQCTVSGGPELPSVEASMQVLCWKGP